jgi:polyphosphate kinase
MISKEKISALIQNSNYVSRDLSWLQFNYRVLDQAKNENRNIFDRLKFLAITASNLDEFFMIRVGSLYNYLDYDKERLDYSGLREDAFKERLFEEAKEFVEHQSQYFTENLMPLFEENGFQIITSLTQLNEGERQKVDNYFINTIFPMLTPMALDIHHPYPVIMAKLLVFGVVTTEGKQLGEKAKKNSFIQIPQNIPRFFEINREDELLFIPIELIIRENIDKMFRNVEIESVSLFRITRNGDFSIEETEDVETDFIDEIKRKLKTRKTGRVVRVEVAPNYSAWMFNRLKMRWDIEDINVFEITSLIDMTALLQIVGHKQFKMRKTPSIPQVTPLTLPQNVSDDIFKRVKKNDILIHHPFNSANHWINMLEAAAEDPDVLSIKITIYRLAKDSRIVGALLKAAENGKYVSVLFEIKARFDEEHNMKQGEKLREAGCFVIYGMTSLKTHAKAMLIVRKEDDEVVRYVHLSSGNYNEDTARFYTDIGLLTADPDYAHDIAEFFNAVTGFSRPNNYNLIATAPHDLRDTLIGMVNKEAENAKKGLPSGIVIKINSLQDKAFINALYEASHAGVPIKLIVRGICCLRPNRNEISENIEVRSLVGDFLEHSRVYYFHNNGEPLVFGGSADAMVRSFDRRIEVLFQIKDERCKLEVINILVYCLKDNVNAYQMNEDGSYTKIQRKEGEPIFNTHEEFYKITPDIVKQAKIF